MARGNFRSGENHGVAEVGSQRRIIDGWVMRKAVSLPSKELAYLSALHLRKLKYIVRVIKGKKYWNVWRTFHKVSNQARTK